MLTFIVIIIALNCVLLTLIILIQNPKGGGLGATFGGFNNNILGAQRTTDFLEKGTWTLGIILIGLALLSAFFTGPGRGSSNVGPDDSNFNPFLDPSSTINTMEIPNTGEEVIYFEDYS